MDQDFPPKVKVLLEEGDMFCQKNKDSRSPMQSKDMKKVKNIYRKCLDIYHGDDTPLMVAARGGFEYLVWGFLECAKQSNMDLHTGEVGEFQHFLEHVNRYDRDTALHIAARLDHFDVVKRLLRHSSLKLLSSYRNRNGKTPLSLLTHDPEYDEFIFDALEELHPLTSTSIWILPKLGSKVYSHSKMDPNSYPRSHINDHTRKSLEKLDDGEVELSADKNTILHLVAMFGDVKYVKDILDKHPSLLYMRNSRGETPTYVAAKEGHLDILAIMISHCKTKLDADDDIIEAVFTRSTDKNTALHIAIQNHHVGVVFLLIKEVPRLATYINDIGESSLYLAAEGGYDAIVKLMLNKCTEKAAFDGPNGKTALHAAAILNSTGCIECLLDANVDLLYIQDKNGWAPLHYAAYYNNSYATRVLLSEDKSVGYDQITTELDGIPAIHIAASRGNRQIMETLVSTCPGCFEVTDSKGRNILHVAVENKKTEVIEFIFQNDEYSMLTSTLINQKDSNGNTPIHLLMASDIEIPDMVMPSRVEINVRNNQKLTPLDMASSDDKRERWLKGIARRHNNKKTRVSSSEFEKEFIKKGFMVAQNVLIVTTLIATATFAAGFTVPGGFDSNQGSKQAGTPILLRESAFQAFVISNAIAFSSSCSVLFGHMMLQVYRLAPFDDIHVKENRINATIGLMYYLTGLAMLAMAIAFVTGIYVVLTPSLGLAIFVCIISIFIIIGSTSVVPCIFR